MAMRSGTAVLAVTILAVGLLDIRTAHGQAKPDVVRPEISDIRGQLRMHEGAVLVGQHGLWGSREIQPDQYRLNLLLILAANPNLLTDRNWTSNFVGVLPDTEAKRYADGRIDRWSWRGGDEFQREAMRRAFIEKEGERLKRLIPPMPFELLDVRGADLESYNFDKGGYILGNGLQSETLVGLKLPFRVPSFWAVPPDKAQAILAQVQATAPHKNHSIWRRAAFVSRLRVTGVRWERDNLLIDTTLVKIEMYAGPDLKTKLGDVPTP